MPPYSWWASRDGKRLFCIVGIGLNGVRWVLKRGSDHDFERPLAELQTLSEAGHWVGVYT